MALLHLSNRELLGTRLQATPPASAFTSAAGGPMNSELITSITSKIGTALETDRVNVIDVNGDGRHIAIDVVSPVFEGKNLVQRQRLVYKAIWLELQDTVHAVDAMSTKTPAEADGS
jgi:stress-induced morphogen